MLHSLKYIAKIKIKIDVKYLLKIFLNYLMILIKLIECFHLIVNAFNFLIKVIDN